MATPTSTGSGAAGAPRREPTLPAADGEDRILTVPNLVTTVRLLLIPVFVWLMLRGHHRDWYPAALLLGGLGATDGVDGFVARRFHQVSTLGKVLDPIADRLLLVTAAVLIIGFGAVPLWVGVAGLAREVVVAAGFLAVVALGGRRMDVIWLGKAGTFGLMVALPLFLGGHANDDWHSVAEALAWVFAGPGLVAGWVAVVLYTPKAVASVKEARSEREVAP